jgi:hypothetical protein
LGPIGWQFSSANLPTFEQLSVCAFRVDIQYVLNPVRTFPAD